MIHLQTIFNKSAQETIQKMLRQAWDNRSISQSGTPPANLLWNVHLISTLALPPGFFEIDLGPLRKTKQVGMSRL